MYTHTRVANFVSMFIHWNPLSPFENAHVVLSRVFIVHNPLTLHQQSPPNDSSVYTAIFVISCPQKWAQLILLWLHKQYCNITSTILDINHRPVFYLKQNVSETVFCLRLQVELTQLGPTDRSSLCFRPNWVGSCRRRRRDKVFETFCFKYNAGQWLISRIAIVILIHHRH
jgi:hypothetical protein